MDDEAEKSAPSNEPEVEETTDTVEKTKDAAEDQTNTAEKTKDDAVKTTPFVIPEIIITSPPASEPTLSTFNEHEILTEQFENYLRIAQALLKTLKRPKDIEICMNLIRKAQRFNDSNQLEVKRNNNHFFRYCLKVLKWTSDNQLISLYNCLYPNKETGEAITETRTWSEVNKSYMALKCLKDGTTIIYSARATDPSAGWQDSGLNILAKRANHSKYERK